MEMITKKKLKELSITFWYDSFPTILAVGFLIWAIMCCPILLVGGFLGYLVCKYQNKLKEKAEDFKKKGEDIKERLSNEP